MMNKTNLLDLNSLLNSALHYSQVDFDSSLILIRKTLEKVIKLHFNIRDIDPPLNDEGHTVLSSMIDDLKQRRILTAKQKKEADYVRRLGNNAAHYTDVKFKKSEVEQSIIYLCGLINDLLYKQKLINNSLFLLTMRRGKLTKKRKLNQTVKQNHQDIKDLLTYSFIKNYEYVADVYNYLDSDFYIDDELNEYIENVGRFLDKYYNWEEEFDPNDYRGKWDSIKSLFGIGGNVSCAETFKGYYRDRIKGFEEQKWWLREKYNF